MPSLFATLIILLYSYLHQIKCGVWLSVYNCLIILENLSQVSTPFLHDRSDFFASELNLIPRPRVPFDTAIAFSLYAKTFPPNRVTGIAAVTEANKKINEIISHFLKFIKHI